MSILQYFAPKHPSHLPPDAFSAKVMKVMAEIAEAKSNRKGQHYHKYTPKMRATISKHSLENGVPSAKRYFARKFNIDMNESTIRNFKKTYVKEKKRKQLEEGSDRASVTEVRKFC